MALKESISLNSMKLFNHIQAGCFSKDKKYSVDLSKPMRAIFFYHFLTYD
ncbi:hypothetical protein SAMN04487907_104115 [Zunongwangia mangrovi]|uniref:Uncharacterized protein n=1 Tax=Zunongwangia mangrovi TaxID=1334022 RepID=A0A1I1J828_9FLAO|nr:hypothetical protein [Zunongwangia mangrovi]SFC41580.1 hypothetical protein SAMN04487907_104115 [Zunongwangia mangrovi]